MVKLLSVDGQVFDVSRTVADQSVMIKNLIDDMPVGGDEDAIPLPNVAGKILAQVIEFCKRHVAGEETAGEGGAAWTDTFVNALDQQALFDLIMAANYLDIKPLLDVTCRKVAQMIKGKTPEEIRQTFGIKNDFTPEEEEQLRKENQWAFE